MREITQIIVHCSDTRATMDIGAKEIRQWHTAKPPRGNGWKDIGYHYVIRRDGIVEPGRALETVGAHVAGHNASSIGICMVGGQPRGDFEPEQFDALAVLIRTLWKRFGSVEVLGHRDLDPHKECPTFDVRKWWASQ